MASSRARTRTASQERSRRDPGSREAPRNATHVGPTRQFSQSRLKSPISASASRGSARHRVRQARAATSVRFDRARIDRCRRPTGTDADIARALGVDSPASRTPRRARSGAPGRRRSCRPGGPATGAGCRADRADCSRRVTVGPSGTGWPRSRAWSTSSRQAPTKRAETTAARAPPPPAQQLGADDRADEEQRQDEQRAADVRHDDAAPSRAGRPRASPRPPRRPPCLSALRSLRSASVCSPASDGGGIGAGGGHDACRSSGCWSRALLGRAARRT